MREGHVYMDSMAAAGMDYPADSKEHFMIGKGRRSKGREILACKFCACCHNKVKLWKGCFSIQWEMQRP